MLAQCARGDDGVAAARGRGEVPDLKNLDTFAVSRIRRRSKGAYDEAVRGVAGIHSSRSIRSDAST